MPEIAELKAIVRDHRKKDGESVPLVKDSQDTSLLEDPDQASFYAEMSWSSQDSQDEWEHPDEQVWDQPDADDGDDLSSLTQDLEAMIGSYWDAPRLLSMLLNVHIRYKK